MGYFHSVQYRNLLRTDPNSCDYYCNNVGRIPTTLAGIRARPKQKWVIPIVRIILHSFDNTFDCPENFSVEAFHTCRIAETVVLFVVSEPQSRL